MIDSEKQAGRTQELILVLKELEDADLSSLDLRLRGSRMKEIYLSEDKELYRHNYSDITDYMYKNHLIDGIPNPDPGAVILDNLRCIQKEWEEEKECPEKEKLCSAIQKLIDHVNLEVVRLSQMADMYYKLVRTEKVSQQLKEYTDRVNEVAKAIQKQQEEAKKVGDELKERKKEVDEIQIDVKNHNTQAITVLSIFSCVVFAFTGGFSLITGALGILHKITKVNAPLLVGVLLMLSIVLVDTVYMLLRAAKHYSDYSQGNLKGFIWCNIIGATVSLGLMLLYYFT